jgi:cell division protease FtsH
VDTEKNQNPTPQIPRYLWWLILLGLILWNLWLFRPASQPEVDIPYSVFVTQVKADNVSEVKITGDEITGTFVRPVLWPEPTPGEIATTTVLSSSTAMTTPSVVPTVVAKTYSEFRTTFPQDVGDPALMSTLELHRVVVDVAPPPSPWFTILLTTGLPLVLLIVLMVWLNRRAGQNQAGIFGFGRSRARRYAGDRPAVTFDDVAGADEAKTDLMEVVDFLRDPLKYHNIGAHIPRGILLVGPPGTGKTLMARAVAGEAEVPFFSLSASEFVEMFVGVGASRVRDLFEQAKGTAPSIVFIDELDAVGAVNDEREQTLNQLLVEMDGFDEHHEVIVLAATNRPDVLDPALLRPGRFDRQVAIGLPDRQGREGILHIHTRNLPLTPDVDLALLARSTTGFSGADLANLCNEAALIAARHSHPQIDRADFDEAIDKVLLGGVRPALLGERERRVVAYHEAGHALVAWLLPEADPVRKVTIIPHGQALGVTTQLPEDDHYNYSQTYLMARLAVMLGGRAAEEIAIGDITTGAESDLVQATRLARRMIIRWGMGDLGPMALQSDAEQPFLGYELAQGRDYSEATAARIDQGVESMLEERHTFVRQLLTAERGQLDKLVQALLHGETVDQDALVQVLGPRPGSEGRSDNDTPA